MRSDNLSCLSVHNSYESQNISVTNGDDAPKLANFPSTVRTVQCMMYLEPASSYFEDKIESKRLWWKKTTSLQS